MALRVLKVRGFARAARKDGLTDAALCAAITEVESGLIDARLGGFLIKKRIGTGGRGKRSGLRTIIAYRRGDRLVCLFVFPKNRLDNVNQRELLALSELGDAYMGMTDAGIAALVAKGVLLEVCCDDAGERKAKD